MRVVKSVGDFDGNTKVGAFVPQFVSIMTSFLKLHIVCKFPKLILPIFGNNFWNTNGFILEELHEIENDSSSVLSASLIRTPLYELLYHWSGSIFDNARTVFQPVISLDESIKFHGESKRCGTAHLIAKVPTEFENPEIAIADEADGSINVIVFVFCESAKSPTIKLVNSTSLTYNDLISCLPEKQQVTSCGMQQSGDNVEDIRVTYWLLKSIKIIIIKL